MSKEQDFLKAEIVAQQRLVGLDNLTYHLLLDEKELFIRSLLRDLFDKLNRGVIKDKEDIDNYVRNIMRGFSTRFNVVASEIQSQMESIALTRQFFYEKYQTQLDLVRDIDSLRAVQKRFFVDFKSVPNDLSEKLRRKIAEIIDKQNVLGVNEKETAKAIQDITTISFNKAYFIATQSQSLYLGWHRYYQIKSLGATKFKYRGTLKNTTREFCKFAMGKPNRIANREDNIWTLKQIETWEKRSWKGKIIGVPLLVQSGGYRCRHAFIPIFT